MQVNLTGFLESKTPKFMYELWKLLLSAQEGIGGIPAEMLEAKRKELEQRQLERQRITGDIQRKIATGEGGFGDELPEKLPLVIPQRSSVSPPPREHSRNETDGGTRLSTEDERRLSTDGGRRLSPPNRFRYRSRSPPPPLSRPERNYDDLRRRDHSPRRSYGRDDRHRSDEQRQSSSRLLARSRTPSVSRRRQKYRSSSIGSSSTEKTDHVRRKRGEISDRRYYERRRRRRSTSSSHISRSPPRHYRRNNESLSPPSPADCRRDLTRVGERRRRYSPSRSPAPHSRLRRRRSLDGDERGDDGGDYRRQRRRHGSNSSRNSSFSSRSRSRSSSISDSSSSHRRRQTGNRRIERLAADDAEYDRMLTERLVNDHGDRRKQH